MKKAICLTLALMLTLSLFSCKNEQSSGEIDTIISNSGTANDAYNASIIEGDTSTDEYFRVDTQYYPDRPLSPDGNPHIDEPYSPEQDKPPSKDEVIKFFKQKIPGCTVVRDPQYEYQYIVTNTNINPADYREPYFEYNETNDVGSPESIEHWFTGYNLEQYITAKAKTTGKFKQEVTYVVTSLPNVSALCYVTYTEFEIIEPYYGDIESGQKITVSDSFAVVYENNKLKMKNTNETNKFITYGGEYLLNAVKEPDGRYLNASTLETLPLDIEFKPYSNDMPGHNYSLYKRFIIDKNIALDRAAETKKLEQLNKNRNLEKAQLTDEQYNGHVPLTEKQQQIINDCKLTTEQQALLERMINKYGEK